MEAGTAISFHSPKTHLPFSLFSSNYCQNHPQSIKFHPKPTKNLFFSSVSTQNSVEISTPLESSDPVKKDFNRVDKSGRFSSPRAARELALMIAYAASLEGSDPVRLFDRRVNAKRDPGYVFDKETLLHYDHMSFGGAPLQVDTEEEADKLILKNEVDSANEAEVLSAPPKLVYNSFVLRLAREILGAVVDQWNDNVLVIDKIIPPNWKDEPAGRILELCILHLAMAEITNIGTRHQIVINEAVDLAKRFCDGCAPRIINGCLRTFVKNRSSAITTLT